MAKNQSGSCYVKGQFDVQFLYRILSPEKTLGVFSGVLRIFLEVGGGGSTNSVEDRRQRERGSGGISPLVRGSTQFSNE
jgi:hypothetical protein